MAWRAENLWSNELKWLVANEANFGFERYNVETWHWNYTLGIQSAEWWRQRR